MVGQLPSGVSYGVAAFSGLVMDPALLAVQRLRLSEALNGSAMVWFLITGLVKQWPTLVRMDTFPS